LEWIGGLGAGGGCRNGIPPRGSAPIRPGGYPGHIRSQRPAKVRDARPWAAMRLRRGRRHCAILCRVARRWDQRSWNWPYTAYSAASDEIARAIGPGPRRRVTQPRGTAPEFLFAAGVLRNESSLATNQLLVNHRIRLHELYHLDASC